MKHQLAGGFAGRKGGGQGWHSCGCERIKTKDLELEQKNPKSIIKGKTTHP